MKSEKLMNALQYVDDKFLLITDLMEAVEARRRERFHLLNSLIAAVAALVIGTSLFFTVNTDARASVFSWIRDVRENSTIYRFRGASGKTLLPQYGPAWIPDGFTLSADMYDDDLRYMLFVHEKNGSIFVFKYSFISDAVQDELINPNAVPNGEKLMIQGMDADYYPSDSFSDTNNLLWFDTEHDIIFSIDSDLDKKTILRIAENVRLERG